jgi:hypothetical protein
VKLFKELKRSLRFLVAGLVGGNEFGGDESGEASLSVWVSE